MNLICVHCGTKLKFRMMDKMEFSKDGTIDTYFEVTPCACGSSINEFKFTVELTKED